MIYGYVVEKSAARVEIRLDRLDPAVVRGRHHTVPAHVLQPGHECRRRDGRQERGHLNISAVVEGDQVAINVEDDGSGMPEEKIPQLLTDRESLDGELHSLGFVFVRQTVAEFGGTVEIVSQVGKGTTTTVRLPHHPGATPTPTPRQSTNCQELGLLQETDDPTLKRPRRPGEPSPKAPGGDEASWGAAILEDYRLSDAPSPGCIFAIAVTEDDEVDFFTHKPYERLWNITHEDLSPMLFEATVRGRLEQNDEKQPVLVLKAPQSVREYFEFKEVAESDRNAATHIRMVHDEYIRIALRHLLELEVLPNGLGRLQEPHRAASSRLSSTLPPDRHLEEHGREVLVRDVPVRSYGRWMKKSTSSSSSRQWRRWPRETGASEQSVPPGSRSPVSPPVPSR